MKFQQYISLFIFLIMIISCQNNQPDNQNTEELENELKEARNKLKAHQQKNDQNIRNLETYGSFSMADEILYLSIPVASQAYEFKEQEAVSSKDINALLIRVSDGSTRRINSFPVRHTIVKKFDLNNIDLSLKELEKDEKLIVITLNSNVALKKPDIDSLSSCIKKLNTYDAEACLKSFRNDDKLLPNEKKGSIIIGFN